MSDNDSSRQLLPSPSVMTVSTEKKPISIYSLLSEPSAPPLGEDVMEQQGTNSTGARQQHNSTSDITARKHNGTTFYDPITNTTRDSSGSPPTASTPSAATAPQADASSPHRLKMSLSEMMNTDGPKGDEGVASKTSWKSSGGGKPGATGSGASGKSVLSSPNKRSPRRQRRTTQIKHGLLGKSLRSGGGSGSSTDLTGLMRQGSNLEGGNEGDSLEEDLDQDDASKQKDAQLPIISVDIPVARPGVKTSESQITFNVTSLCEDKYGFNAIHPGGRIALDLEDEVDDDMDGEEDEVLAASKVLATPDDVPAPDEEYDEADDIVKQLSLKFRPGMTDDEKEEMVLKELHRRRMEDNKRIGKYDIEDPFIDDEELQFEEQTNKNKDGFFVYYGPWVEPDQSRGGSNGRRRFQSTSSTKRRRTIATDSAVPSRSVSIRSNSNLPSNSSRSNSVLLDADKEVIAKEVQREPKEVQKETSKDASKDGPNKSSGSEVVVAPVIATSSTSNSKIIIGSLPIS
ncbi:DEKNAAC103024 [Brettanomyces naardenensis]|uniref:DEKNAAC103024 n=1 Tax=Brettanomyces naardenensis TaxID=13370 RepID=A0A448YM46_BRENA|nr:DEKNAAC103024 [Brettanomyces naardenensis]